MLWRRGIFLSFTISAGRLVEKQVELHRSCFPKTCRASLQSSLCDTPLLPHPSFYCHSSSTMWDAPVLSNLVMGKDNHCHNKLYMSIPFSWLHVREHICSHFYRTPLVAYSLALNGGATCSREVEWHLSWGTEMCLKLCSLVSPSLVALSNHMHAFICACLCSV